MPAPLSAWELRWLKDVRDPGRGRGDRWRLGTVVVLLVAGGALLGLMPVDAPSPTQAAPRLTLAAAAVVEPGDGSAPGALDGRERWPAGSRLQLTFETGQESWSAALWFEGMERVVPLYPDLARRQAGWTAARSPYVLPGRGAYLRLTPTGEDGDFLAVVTSLRPDPEVLRVLEDPQPAAVRALRERLEREAAARHGAGIEAERFLPTADGRALAVPWIQLRGRGVLVEGWGVRVVEG